MESSPCKCAKLQKIGYKSADLRKESRLRTYGSACGREQGLVHMSLTRKHFCESRHFSTQVGLHSTEVRRLPRAPHGAQWNGGGGKSQFFKLFTLLTNQEGWGKKKRAVQIYFWNSFLIKYFGFAKPMNCWITQTSEELKFKMPSEPAGGCPPPIPSCLCTEEITLWNNGRHGVYSVSIFSPCLPGGSASRSSPRLKVSMPQTPDISRLQIQTKTFPQTFHSL